MRLVFVNIMNTSELCLFTKRYSTKKYANPRNHVWQIPLLKLKTRSDHHAQIWKNLLFSKETVAYSNCAIPTGCTYRCSIGTCSETTYPKRITVVIPKEDYVPIFVSVENRMPNTFERIPNAYSVVTVAGEEDSSTDTEVYAINWEENRLFLVDTHLTIRSEIKQTTLQLRNFGFFTIFLTMSAILYIFEIKSL